jgi:hypothetical protein
MRDDYLWDGSGASDPDVLGLEELLRPLGHRGQPFARPPRVPIAPVRPPLGGRWFSLLALAASGLALGLMVWARAGAPPGRPAVVAAGDASTPDAGPADGND